MFDLLINNSVKDVKKMSSSIYAKIESKEIVPIKRNIIADSIVWRLNEENNKRKRVIMMNLILSKRLKFSKHILQQSGYDENTDSDDDSGDYS